MIDDRTKFFSIQIIDLSLNYNLGIYGEYTRVVRWRTDRGSFKNMVEKIKKIAIIFLPCIDSRCELNKPALTFFETDLQDTIASTTA